MEIEQVVKAVNVIGEGPRWNAAEQKLYWVDFIENQNIHSWHPQTGQLQTYPTGVPVTALGFRRAGRLIIATGGSVGSFDPATLSLDAGVTLEAGESMRFNDGAVDAAGRFWVGSMNSRTPEQPLGSLYRVDADGSHRVMDSGFTVSNGLGWSPDHRTFYFVDTFRRAVYAYDFSLGEGTIKNRRVFVETTADDGLPDGLTVDSQGHVYVAFWGGWKIHRYDPDGRLERTIRFPIANPTACTFGGRDLDELYVTSARLALTPAELAAQPLAGDLFRVRLGVRGQPEPLFG